MTAETHARGSQGVPVDRVTGQTTTGHEWDGISELNTPLPRWWLWTFYLTIVWAIAYWIVYPAWPLASSFTRGLFGWASREAVVVELDALKAQRGTFLTRITQTPLEDIGKDAALMSFATAQGRAAFGDNCAPCHGAGGGGGKGFPNLNDDEWLWGGKLADISQTITHGIRWAADEQTRVSAMPAFGRDGVLKRPEVNAVAHYVRSLAGLQAQPKADLALGATIYEANCAACHGEKGLGNRELGAPNLTDAIWLYGSEHAAIVEGVWNGRGAAMPAWGGRLDETTIKALTVYVHSLGGGE